MNVSLRTSLPVAQGLVLLATTCAPLFATHRRPANVPPTMEIEVIDPNADPLGRPAVELQRRENGGFDVDIPPVILVHRYYYTGDRSFQAQLLPGGPTIIVANHPKTGEKLYIEAQMMPGAPRVTYTARFIDYDFGRHGMKILFFGRNAPFVKYRNGKQWHRVAGELVKVDKIRERAGGIKDRAQDIGERTKTVSVGVFANVVDVTKTVTLPVKNIVVSLPVGKQLFGSNLGESLTIRAAEFQRDRGAKRAQAQARLNNLSIPTIR